MSKSVGGRDDSTDLLLEVESTSNDGDRVCLQITTELSTVRVHGDQLLELSSPVNDTMVRAKGKLK